jgi:allantoinase
MTGSPTLPSDRVPFSAIVDRPPMELPGKAKIIVWTIVNLEVWDISRPMARQVIPAPTGQVLLPDVPNWSWHEYGMRVGVWRFFDLYKRLGIQPTLSINARVVEDYARVAQEAKDAGWEFMGHAWEQMPIHKVEDQSAMINRCMDRLEDFTGTRPVGWLGPGLTQTYETPELLAEAGVKYIGDWVYDDEPTVIKTDKGPLVTLPYSVELNDIPTMIVQHHESELLAEEVLRPVRSSLARGQRAAPDHGHRHPSLHLRPAAPHQVSRRGLRPHQQPRGRAALERGADLRLVQRTTPGARVSDYVITPPAQASLAISGTQSRFPVRRVYCVGRNYEKHVLEMNEGADLRDPPFFFQKPADAIVEDGATVPFPPMTDDLQHEVELVACIGTGGANIPVADALDHVAFYAVGIDLTRRDLQFRAREKSWPWEMGKSFDHSAPIGPLTPVSEAGHGVRGISLSVNGVERQNSDTAHMTWSVAEVISRCPNSTASSPATSS